ncbi:MAG: T9SS type A sorting domain-containing protein [bacterium]|jgi:hypothetical protein
MRRASRLLIAGLCLVLMPALAAALTYTTPTTTDGVIENATPQLGGTEWESDELIETDGGTDFHLTWDDTTFFNAIQGTYADQEDGDYDWFIAYDVDLTPGSGATSDGYSHVTFSGKFLPDVIYYRSGGFGWYEYSIWDGAQWVFQGWSDACSYGGWDGNLVSELCIPESLVVDADSIAVCSWITDEDQNSVVASFPKANPIGATPQAMTYFFVTRDTGQNVAPNSLPVEPAPPSATVDNERSFAHTCTGLADITPGNCGSTTQMTFYYTVDGSDPDSNSAFVAGTYDTCRVGGDTTDTFYAIFSSAPDESTVKWIAKGVSKTGIIDWSDAVQSFVQGGTAWVGNEGSTPTDCTIWAEIYEGDEGTTSWVKFDYTTDGSDPMTSGTVQTIDGTFDAKLGNNDKFYAVLDMVPTGTTVNWFAYGEDMHDNYAQSDTFFTFEQGDTADYYNLTCNPDSNYVTAEVGPSGYGSNADFIWTTDGTDPKTSGTAHTAVGYFIASTDSTDSLGAYLTADVGNTIKWYIEARGSDNSYGESAVQTCTAGTTSGPLLCNLAEDSQSLMVNASISPRGYGSEIRFIYTHDGTDPKTSPTAYSIEGSYVRDDGIVGNCPVPTAVFDAQLYAKQGETVKWYAHGWYQTHNKYNGLYGDSDVRTFTADSTHTGVPHDSGRVLRLSNSPNPFTGATNIMFTLTSKSYVRIRVFDISGRMVANLYEGLAAEGENVVEWDGRTSRGEKLPAGLYFYRFESRDFQTTRKAILVR